MQYRSGAYHADLAFDPDEPAHATSSLMVRDYMVERLGSNPRAFGYEFYAHYPKVAIGHWPPLFYVSEALWMLIAGRSRAGLLLFTALCGAALICSLYCTVRKRTSTAAVLVSVAVFVQPRLFDQMLTAVHPDMLLALLVFIAAVHCGNWLHSRSRFSGFVFVVFALAALAVHGRGAVLLMLPFILLPVRPGISKWWWATAAVLVVGMLLLPYRLGQVDRPTIAASIHALRAFGRQLWRVSSWWTLLLSSAGMVLALHKRPRETSFWMTMAALVGCNLLFFVIAPVPWDDRYLLTTWPAVAALAALAVQCSLVRLRTRRVHGPIGVAVSAVAILVIASSVMHVEVKPDLGYRQFVTSRLFQENNVILIDGDGRNEGGLIVESSLVDPSRTHTILRGSKVLAQTNWVLRNFRLIYSSPQDLLAALDRAHVGLILLQNDGSRPDFVQLRSALSDDVCDWTPISESSSLRGVTEYRRTR